MIRRSDAIRLAVMVAATISSLAAQGSFTPLNSPNSQVWGMSGDGSVVVGFRDNMGPVFRWTAATGAVDIGGTNYSVVISKDGKTIVGQAADSKGINFAAIWQGGTNWKTLGGFPNAAPIDNILSWQYGVSGDGTVIVGLAYRGDGSKNIPRAFRWDAKSGMVDLGSGQNSESRANAISVLGNVIGGWDAAPGAGGSIGPHSYWMGVVWYGGQEQLMNPFGWIGQVTALNDVGSVIVGRGHPMNQTHAYRFTAWDGKVEDLGALVRWTDPPPTPNYEDTSVPNAVSEDGGMVVGISGDGRPGFPQEAFIWTEGTKMLRLRDYLISEGVPVPSGWLIVNATAISSNKKIIGGFGINPEGWIDGFMAKLP